MDPAAFGISALAGFLLGAGGAVTVAGAWVATSRKALLEQVRQSELTTQLVQERSGEAAERALSGESAVQRMATKAAELEIELANTREAAGRLDERYRASEKRGVALDQARENAKRELASALAHNARIDRALASLGVVVPEQAWSPIASDRRLASRDSLRALLVDTGAAAVALVDRDGLSAFAAGPDEITERLAVAGALFATIEPALGVVLCAPVRELSLTTRRGATHLFAVPGTGWLVALENQGAAPRHAIARALLDLFGKPSPASPLVEVSAVIPESSRQPDPAVERILRAWATRWRVEQISLLDAVGQPIGASHPGNSGPLYGLRRALAPIYSRLARDGWPLDDVEILARTEDLSVAVRAVDGDLESPVLVASSGRLPEFTAIDELAATLRWHLAPSASTASERRAV